MAVNVKFKTTGVPELFAALQAIDKKVARKSMRSGIKEINKAVLAKIKSLVQVETKTLRKAQGSKIVSFKSGLVQVGITGARFDAKPKPGKQAKPKKFSRKVKVKGLYGEREMERTPTYYAHLVEFGTRAHSLGKGARIARKDKRRVKVSQHGMKHPGAVEKPFMRPAHEYGKSISVETIRKHLLTALAAIKGK